MDEMDEMEVLFMSAPLPVLLLYEFNLLRCLIQRLFARSFRDSFTVIAHVEVCPCNLKIPVFCCFVFCLVCRPPAISVR